MFEERATGNYILTHIFYDGEEMTPSEVVNLLNELYEENEKLRQLYKVYEKAEEVEEKAKDCLIQELKEENEALKKFINDNFNTMMDSKMVIDDEPFEFNKNCAKPYNIKSVSPNGVIRLGKKNYKAKWRMKNVKEINNELPPREEFNREEYNKLRNKFHTKHWCGDDVLGRIIYNIYEGTFDDYL